MQQAVPKHLKYTPTHEWVQLEEDGTLTIGITEHAQALLGDIVHLELAALDSEVSSGEEVGVLESVKAAADIYAPASGTVIALNEMLGSAPELINSDPYGRGWLYKLDPDDVSELKELLDAKAYAAHVLSEGH